MMWLKSCPKCRGDLFLDKDEYGWYKECLQCGYMSYQNEQQQRVAGAPSKAKEREDLAVA